MKKIWERSTHNLWSEILYERDPTGVFRQRWENTIKIHLKDEVLFVGYLY
jgi:hypothetical protein